MELLLNALWLLVAFVVIALAGASEPKAALRGIVVGEPFSRPPV